MRRIKGGRRKWKRYILIASILCGAFYFAEMRYCFFRMRNIVITPGNVIPEEVIWQALPKNVDDFWPLLFFCESRFERRIMDYYPVSVDLAVTGWGKYRVDVAPLDIFLAVSWNSEHWWLSSGGRMWRANLPAGGMVKGMAFPNRPILSWDLRLPVPIDPEHQRCDIYPSSLPVARITKWYDTLDRIEWKNSVYCLMAKKIEGRQMVHILLGSSDRITGEIIVKDDASDWLSLAAALENIYPSASGGVPDGLVINATYTDMMFTVLEKRKM
ncbi:MAG: hypothetical protein LBK91_00785 [Synergistaceae bacterium]|nr:hypothetical protein [Synergistaceae bacterium]